MKCPFKYKTSLPPCICLHNYRWGYLKDFLQNKPRGERESLVCHKIKCLEFLSDHIEIKKEACIKCLFCLFGCPGHLIEIDKDFNLSSKCNEFKKQNPLILHEIDLYFKGSLVKFGQLDYFLSANTYRSFKEFTEVDETQNLSIWAINALKFLSQEDNPRIGIEINMLIKRRDRGGRLDLSMLSGNMLYVGEAKVSFEKMMQENRYITQIVAYREEIKNTLSELKLDLSSCVFLLINGKESDLLPYSDLNCTSTVGDQAKIFYETILKHRIFFVSSYALWALALKKIFSDNHKYSIDNVFKKLFESNSIGLLSSGVLGEKGGQIVISDLDSII